MPELIIKKCSKCNRKAVAFEDDFANHRKNRIAFVNGDTIFCDDGCRFNESFVLLSSIMGQEGYMCDTILDSVSDLQDISDYETEKQSLINEANAINKSYQDVKTEYSIKPESSPINDIFSKSEE
jgi:hypothetical protein